MNTYAIFLDGMFHSFENNKRFAAHFARVCLRQWDLSTFKLQKMAQADVDAFLASTDMSKASKFYRSALRNG
jgi:hypothetical protein